MFQRWSRGNNPQANVLNTVPRAVWHHGVVSSTVPSRKKVASWCSQTLHLHAGLCRGGPYTSLADSGNNIKTNDLNETVEPDYSLNADARRIKNFLYGTLHMQMKRISRIEEMVQNIDEFCRIKKHVPANNKGCHGGVTWITSTSPKYRMTADCRGLDWSRSCWRCEKERHTVEYCSRKPRYYLFTAREERPWDDHIAGTMRCKAFWVLSKA